MFLVLICSLSLRNLRYTWDICVLVTRVFVTEVQTPVVQIIQPQANIPPSYQASQPAQNYAPYPTGSTGTYQNFYIYILQSDLYSIAEHLTHYKDLYHYKDL